MAFLVAAVLLAAFVVNVVMGAVGGGQIVGNVGEMLILFSASIAFVAAILKSEAKAKAEAERNK